MNVFLQRIFAADLIRRIIALKSMAESVSVEAEGISSDAPVSIVLGVKFIDED